MAKNDISSVYVEVVVNADGTVKPMSAAQKAFSTSARRPEGIEVWANQ